METPALEEEDDDDDVTAPIAAGIEDREGAPEDRFIEF